MNRIPVVLAFFAALAGAYLTKDMTAPPQHRVKTQGRRFLQTTAALPTAPAADDPAGDAVDAPAPDTVPTEPEPEPEPEVIELRTITDLTLCHADKAVDPPFKASCEIHVGPDGELSWHAGKNSRQLSSIADLKRSLDVKFHVPDIVWVPDQMTNWVEIRHLTNAAFSKQRPVLWIGCARPDEPDKLRVLKFHRQDTVKPKRPEGEVFEIHVEEGEDGPAVTVNGTPIETFPSDFATAWMDWAKANPDVADTSAPTSTHVILNAKRFTPCSHVIAVLDVMRGVGIEHEFLDGDVGRPRK